MRIGVDASSLLRDRSGVGRYTLNLVTHLPEADPEGEFVLFMTSLRVPPPREVLPPAGNVRVCSYRFPGRLLYRLWTHLRWPAIDRLVGPLDLFHSTNYFVFPLRRAKQVVTVHDLHFIHRPGDAQARGGRLWGTVLRRRLAEIDWVIAVSERTRREFLELFPYPPERTTTIHEAVDSVFLRPPDHDEIESVYRAHGLSRGDYLMWVGTLEPRKNLEGLLAAYRLLLDRRRSAPPLVLVGGLGFGYEDILRTIARDSALRRRVRRLGYVPDRELRALYRGATIFVFPSREEGFGLPPLEAMACGAPVLANRLEALREVLGGACEFVDCAIAEALADRLESLLEDGERRQRMGEQGRRRAAEYSWPRVARETIAVYRKALAE